MVLYRKNLVKEENPKDYGWYDTDKGLLYYFLFDEEWSCRDDRLSEEYPTCWYERVEKS